MDARRTQRVAETIREELTELIRGEMGDPRMAALEVSCVILAPDLRTARVQVTAAGAPGAQQDAIRALHGARGFLRRQLSTRIPTWRSPELQFELDRGANSSRIEELLDRAAKWRAKLPDSSPESR
jgi:ribosome-binding factor A